MKNLPSLLRPFLALAVVALGVPGWASAGLTPTDLRCDYLTNPLGIDAVHPDLSWTFQGATAARGKAQSAFRILVASSRAKLSANDGDLWDSGKVPSSETAHVVYGGSPLTSREACFWKVEVWDEQDQASAWSRPASWEMGLLQPTDWPGTWIGIDMPTPTNYATVNPAPFLRRDFQVMSGVKRARLYASGVGNVELHLNGKKVGDTRERDPGYTDFRKRVLYVTHDVTSLLRPGSANTVGAILGTGWYDVHDIAVWGFENAPWRGRPRMLMALVVEYANGKVDTIASDTSWRATTEGPIRFDGIYTGEIYDASREMKGWSQPGFDDKSWKAADEMPAPTGTLVALSCPPVRIKRTIKPKAVTEPQPGVFVVDMGENFSGHAQIKVQGPAGTRIRMRYSEALDGKGMIDRRTISQFMPPPKIFQEDTYICSGKGTETWEQRFSYSGFRYVEVTGFPGKPTVENFRGRFATTDFEPVGEFSCSNPGLNKVQQATLQSYLSNAQDIPTDCPSREKNGWTGDAHLAAEAGLMNFRTASFYAKWLDDLEDNQRPDGRVSVIVPSPGWGMGERQPAWDSAYILIPWYLYEYTGDAHVLAKHFDGMRSYIDALTTKTDNGVITLTDRLGDWCPWSTETPSQLTDTAFYYGDLTILAKAAAVLNRPEDAAKYTALAEKARAGFNAKFLNPAANSYANGSQTALAAALYFGLVPDENRAAVTDSLVKNIQTQKHIDTGILGAKWVPAALSNAGLNDVAYMLVANKGVPGWIKMAEESNTLWEQWQDPQSRNHIMFGSVSGWFYHSLAGINFDPEHPGFEQVIIRPQPSGDLTWVKASYQSVRGLIVSDWSLKGGVLTMEVTIPANTRATIYIPTADENTVMESGKPVGAVPGVKFVGHEEGGSAFSVGSGTYRFSAPYQKKTS